MLEVSGLQAFYGDSHILQTLDIALAAGERVAVLGRNGAGKTTLMKSIMNAGPRVAGTVRWNGRAFGGAPPYARARAGLCLVPEDRRIFSHLTVIENLLLARDGSGDRAPLEPERVLDWFPMLRQLGHRYGNQLSGGQQQMLAVARGVVPRPKLILLDEPTEGLAPIIVQQLATAVREICQSQDMGLLLSEQNIWFARRCTDRLHVIDSGRFVFHGTWHEFDAAEAIKSRYLAV